MNIYITLLLFTQTCQLPRSGNCWPVTSSIYLTRGWRLKWTYVKWTCIYYCTNLTYIPNSSKTRLCYTEHSRKVKNYSLLTKKSCSNSCRRLSGQQTSSSHLTFGRSTGKNGPHLAAGVISLTASFKTFTPNLLLHFKFNRLSWMLSHKEVLTPNFPQKISLELIFANLWQQIPNIHIDLPVWFVLKSLVIQFQTNFTPNETRH